MVNPWEVLAGFVLAVALAVGAYFFGHHVGAQAVQVAWDKDRLAQAKTLSDAKGKAAAQLKTAQEAANAAVARADDNAKSISDRNADLQRRIAGLQRADAVCRAGLPPADHHPETPLASAADTVVVSRSVVETAADCARDYATVATQLEAIGKLTQ